MLASSGFAPPQLDPPPSPLYPCTTVVPMELGSAKYLGLPFLSLRTGDTIQVLYEAGHPNQHNLPFPQEPGDDCLLVARDERGTIGWAFASFVMPLVSEPSSAYD